MTADRQYGNMVASKTVADATVLLATCFEKDLLLRIRGKCMSTIMRKMNIISRCEGIYRTSHLSEEFPAIYHSYILGICRNPGMSQEMLARYLCINKSNVTRHLAFLEKEGYIERKVSREDKRQMLVFPTQKMLDIRSGVLAVTREWNERIAEGISEEELEVFHRVLQKMTDRSVDIIYGEERQE